MTARAIPSSRRRPVGVCCLLALTLSSAPPASFAFAGPAVQSGAAYSVAASVSGTWEGLPPPGGRQNASAILDPVEDRLVVFGGFLGAGGNDVWVLPLSGLAPAWSRLVPGGTPPPPRWAHSAVYDPVRHRMLVFGGENWSWSGDRVVWALTFGASPEWSVLATAGTPPSERSYHSAVYDPIRDRMVIFGGRHSNAPLNDAWSLSLSGTPTWTEMVTGLVVPDARFGHVALYDATGDRMLVFGGSFGVLANDLWVLSLSGTPSWSLLAPSGVPPSARVEHAAVYDAARNRMLVFGGASTNTRLNDVWELPLSGPLAWTQLAPAGPFPTGRYGSAAIYTPVCDCMIVFGGYDGYDDQSDVWALSLVGAPTWNSYAPFLPSAPHLYQHIAVADPVRDRMLTWGGAFALNNLVGVCSFGDGGWSQVSPLGPQPTLKSDASAIYDPVRDRVLIFGGFNYPFPRQETWALQLSDILMTWGQPTIFGSPPSGRSGHSAIYDPVRDAMWIFGGKGLSNELNDVIELSLAGVPEWFRPAMSGSPPTAREGHSAIYDPVRDRMIVFGGYNGASARNDLWQLALSGTPAWSPLAADGTPPSVRFGHTAIYDPVRDRMVVFGGANTAGERFDETWELSLSGAPSWTLLSPGGANPGARWEHTAVYDVARDRMVVYGGRATNGQTLNDGQALAWNAPSAPGLACPGDVTWIAGTPNSVAYTIPNPWGFAQSAEYTLTSARQWPGFPITGSVALGAGSSVTANLAVPVPDTTAAGTNDLRLGVRWRGVAQYATCWHRIHDALTPTLASLVAADADGGRIRIVWYTPEGRAGGAEVERRESATDWSVVGEAVAEGSGLLTFIDRNVVAGRRYGYRLALFGSGGITRAGEVWLDVPLNIAPSLAVSSSNPCFGKMRVSLSLPRQAAADLELFDVRGRRVTSRAVGVLGPGSHVVDLAEASRLAAGVYLIRLTQDHRSRTATVVVIR